MNCPPFLKKGDQIGITCPSGFVSRERVAFAAEMFRLWDFRVKVGATVGHEHHYFSGTDEERAEDLQTMLDDPELSAIFMGRGGYGLSRIIDRLDFSLFLQKPKWICGFSDITVLHSHLQARWGIPTLHSPMGAGFTSETVNSDSVKSFFSALSGLSIFYHAPAFPLNRGGQVEGVVVGGNLALLTHLIGSVSDIDTNGRILFIEDVGEHLYQIDRMMVMLRRAGKLAHLKGLIVGGFTELEDTSRPFGQTVEEIIFEKIKDYHYPVCFHFPVGHIVDNYTLRLGMPHQLIVGSQGTRLSTC